MSQAARSKPILSTDLPSIEAEVRVYLDDIEAADKATGASVIELGRRLTFVKENYTKHGEWIPWLNRINIAKRTAQDYMKVAALFGNTRTSALLSASKLFVMTSLPSNINIETFLSVVHTIPSNPTSKTVADMTIVELREVVRVERERSGMIRKKPANRSVEPVNAADPFSELCLSEEQAAVLEKLPLCIARRIVKDDPAEVTALLEVALRLSSLVFSENYPDILDRVRTGVNPQEIARSYKSPPSRQSFGGIDVDPYEILGVYEGDDERVIRDRYRGWIKIFHPDRGGSEFLFKLITKAWREFQRLESAR